MSFITDYEKTTAGYIERELSDSDVAKVKLWADAFSTDASARQRSMLFFGHQRTERFNHTKDTDGKTVYTLRYTLEFRVEIFTLRNHQSTLNLIEKVLDDILAGYKPYLEFTPFLPGESGQAVRNNANNSWIYSGFGTTSIKSDVEQLTPIDEVLEGEIIYVGLYNAHSEDTTGVIGGLARE